MEEAEKSPDDDDEGDRYKGMLKEGCEEYGESSHLPGLVVGNQYIGDSDESLVTIRKKFKKNWFTIRQFISSCFFSESRPQYDESVLMLNNFVSCGKLITKVSKKGKNQVILYKLNK